MKSACIAWGLLKLRSFPRKAGIQGRKLGTCCFYGSRFRGDERKNRSSLMASRFSPTGVSVMTQ